MGEMVGKVVIVMVGAAAVLLLAILLGVGLNLIFAIPFMWAWNYVMPALFGLKTIGFLQSFCLLFVSGMLFKSYNHNSSSKS